MSQAMKKWESEFYHEVGARMTLARKQRGLRQEDVAPDLGVARASYANMEAGRQRIATHVVFRAAVLFNIPAAKLIPEPR